MSQANTSLAGGKLLFSEAGQVQNNQKNINPWKLLVVDDEEVVHAMSRMILEGYLFKGRHIDILSAYSAAEAKTLLEKHPDVAVILLDVVMETDDAGLQLIQFIRHELNNGYIRIIVRTGQSGLVKESKVVSDYDINGYEEKTALTAQKLLTAVTTALRAYADLMRIADLVRFKEGDFDDAKHAFLSRMSHELLTPMNAIVGFTQLLSLNASENFSPMQQGSLEQIFQGCERLLGLLRGLLELTDLEKGELKLTNENVDVKPLLEYCLDKVSDSAKSKQIRLVTSVEKNYCIRTDAKRLKQIVITLLANAVKHNRDNGTISLNCQENQNRTLQISIADTGPGLSEKVLTYVFEPFGLLETSHEAESGISISLAISKMLVENMGGQLTVESRFGEGSTFHVELPLTEEAT